MKPKVRTLTIVDGLATFPVPSSYLIYSWVAGSCLGLHLMVTRITSKFRTGQCKMISLQIASKMFI